ncbi:MAG TPA: hypothetical protein VJR23_16365 [Candidatus Acidoferrales bacterium]|nr:hypothetical protein [Candidatus Acidoferrales bacterium]
MRVGAAIAGSVADAAAIRQAKRQMKPVYAMAMNVYLRLITSVLLFQVPSGVKPPPAFLWEWKNGQELFAAQSLRNAKIDDSERTVIAKAIEAQLRPDMADLGIHSEGQLAKAALDTRVKMIDVNGDGTPEVIAQGMKGCGVVGNCSLWVFRKVGNHYGLILSGYGQTFTIQTESTKGFKDIVVASHSSATDSALTLFRYDGSRYQAAGCYDANWAPLENGIVHQLKEPRITSSACD